MCLGIVFFASILFGTLCASWTTMSTSFTKLGKFSFIIFSNKFSTSYSFSSSSGTPMIRMFEVVPGAPYPTLCMCVCVYIYNFFWILFSSCWSDWIIFLPCVPSHLCDSQLYPLHCWFPANFSLFHLTFIYTWVLSMLLKYPISSLSILITSLWTLHLLDCLSPFWLVLCSRVLFCSFI